MPNAVGDYTDWSSITYAPAIAELPPFALLPYISKGQSALEVGCNTGNVALFLATQGLSVIGIDLNPEAIDLAQKRVSTIDLRSRLRFAVADITQFKTTKSFDVVLLIRVLTCFPRLSAWKLTLDKARSLLRTGGFIYIHDFLMTPDDKVYRERYAYGIQQGWRVGDFLVTDRNAEPLFVAHHHPEHELEQIKEGYSKVFFDTHESVSMNGNPCMMFEFIGVKV